MLAMSLQNNSTFIKQHYNSLRPLLLQFWGAYENVDMKEAHVVSIFRVKVCRVGEFLCVDNSLRKTVRGQTGVAGLSLSMGRVDREICAMKEPSPMAFILTLTYTCRPIYRNSPTLHISTPKMEVL